MTERMTLAEFRQREQSSKRGVRSKDKELLGRWLGNCDVTWTGEYRFHPTRKWRFDWASPIIRLAVEFEGGVFTGGGHTRGDHYTSDAEKYSEAAILGWIVIRCTAPMVRDGRAFDLIERAIKARE